MEQGGSTGDGKATFGTFNVLKVAFATSDHQVVSP